MYLKTRFACGFRVCLRGGDVARLLFGRVRCNAVCLFKFVFLPSGLNRANLAESGRIGPNLINRTENNQKN